MSTVSGLRGGRGGGTGGAVTVEGLDQLNQFLDILAELLPLAMGFQLEDEAAEIMELSRPLVPVDPLQKSGGYAELKMSWLIGGVRFTKDRAVLEAGYGGPSVSAAGNGYDYSQIQHETRDYKHTTGQWKFLQFPAEVYGQSLMRASMEKALWREIRAAKG